ncbi:TPA: YadA-like family protein [Escherichia coli]|uniref:YadA-like family protein n=4 Tax=Escherichia coli TaxID=562 RepID=UPI000E02FB21|nr:YadA C-terminal domain-containing protein [Escherichia coli]EAB9245828.1 immunoglobulin-binding protein [Escherichia coli]EFC9972563.1 immunoglobulin-binding protein [Escherichia coli]EFN3693675.1 immunoglobulin-binding protein [Escherichia coli]EGO5187762.1 immunoglobulin-binding protein [Escherichia coli]EGO5840572.1 immunoglobulin-binding protein [Escherichia coli]
MLKRRDAFLKKSALAVSMALLLSAQAQAVLTGPVDANSSSLLIGENSFITNSTGTANNTFLLGGGAFNMDSPGSLQFGSFSGVYNSPHSVTLGRDAGQAESKYGVAIGKSAEVLNSQHSVAIGGWAGIENSSGSVALGHGSQVSGENNVVSVGAGPEGYGKSVKGAPETRRIINVSDGINNTDAATVGQLNERFDDAQVFLLQTNERIDETDKRLSTVHAELSRDIIAGTSAAVTYTDVTALALQDEIKDGTNKVRDELKSQGDSLRGEIGGVYRDARAHTDSQVTAVRDELKAEGDSLRGEIGGVYRDARAHTDSQVTAVRDELSRDIIAGTSAAVAYTDASSLALQDEIKEKADETVQVSRAYTDKSVRDARKEAKSQAEHLSDVLVKNRAQTDAAIASNTAAIRNNSHRLDLTEAWQKMATERMNNMQEQIKENRKELRESAAQSAALAGLFQPYSVGKFNATAAVGGYRDEQAIAVGVGYRFTENVAGKVAVAAGGSSASWNAGVNFEF